MADRKRKELEFEPGDWVFLKLQPYRQGSVGVRCNQKLAARYHVPFQILRRVGKVAYELPLPAGCISHFTVEEEGWSGD